MESAKDAARVFEYLGLQYEGAPVEKTRLNKLLYFAQGYSLAKRGSVLFENKIDAWNHGPVVAVVYTGFDKIVSSTEKNGILDVKVTPEEMDIIMDVWEQYHSFTAKQLVDMTHQVGTPWYDTYKPGIKNAHIPVELIEKYFSMPENKPKSVPGYPANVQIVDVLPADEYDPEEDAMWEDLLNGTR